VLVRGRVVRQGARWRQLARRAAGRGLGVGRRGVGVGAAYGVARGRVAELGVRRGARWRRRAQLWRRRARLAAVRAVA
jgi:hypothetical protein